MIEVIQGDITKLNVDAIVNAANNTYTLCPIYRVFRRFNPGIFVAFCIDKLDIGSF